MDETCDRCGPAVRAYYRADRAGEVLSVRALREPAMAGTVGAWLDDLAHS